MEYKIGLKFFLDNEYEEIAKWCNENGCCIVELEPENDKRVFEIQKTVADKNVAILDLKYKLEKTDHKAIKFAEGLISAEDYEPIKQQRQAWRDEINELEQQIK